MLEERESSFKTLPSAGIVIVLPLLLVTFYFMSILYIVHKTEQESPFKSKMRVLIYLFVQFICLPFLLFFILVNIFFMLISYFCCKKLVYVSAKNAWEFLVKLFGCNLSTNKSMPEVNVIQIKKKEEEPKLPERASKYKEVADNSNATNNQNKVISDSPLALNINIPREHKTNNAQDNKQNIFDNKEQENKQNIFDNNNNRPNTGRVKDKSKIVDFLTKALVNTDNSPGFITIFNSLKNEAKKKKERVEQEEVNNVVKL